MVKKQILLIFAALLVIAPLFHNCGSQMSALNKSVEFSSEACDSAMLPVFENTYHQFFLKNNCTQCHSSTGIDSIPHFADLNASIGYSYFKNIGPDRVENKLRAGHQTYNFSSLQDELFGYKKQWMESQTLSSCNDQDVITGGRNLQFFEPNPNIPGAMWVKPTMLGWQTITWNLDNGTSSDTDGVQLSMDVQVAVNPDFNSPLYYLAGNVRVKSTKHGIHLKNITLLLNNKTYFVTTFKAIDVTIDKGSDFQLVTEGSAAATFMKESGEDYENADLWSVQIETFEATN